MSEEKQSVNCLDEQLNRIIKEKEFRIQELDFQIQEMNSGVGANKFAQEINKQELLRRAIEVGSNAFCKLPLGSNASNALQTLTCTATEKLTKAVENL